MPSNLNLDDYYGTEADQYSFYRIPKTLLTDPRYKGVSIEAKVLYGLLPSSCPQNPASPSSRDRPLRLWLPRLRKNRSLHRWKCVVKTAAFPPLDSVYSD